MIEGIIVKALSGFYYVAAEGRLIECKARGRFRLDGSSPLVGDRVLCSLDAHGKGRVDEVKERKNWFIRPAVANIDTLVFIAANTNPVTDPFLVDRFSVIAAEAGCELVICIKRRTLIRVTHFLKYSQRLVSRSCVPAPRQGRGQTSCAHSCAARSVRSAEIPASASQAS